MKRWPNRRNEGYTTSHPALWRAPEQTQSFQIFDRRKHSPQRQGWQRDDVSELVDSEVLVLSDAPHSPPQIQVSHTSKVLLKYQLPHTCSRYKHQLPWTRTVIAYKHNAAPYTLLEIIMLGEGPRNVYSIKMKTLCWYSLNTTKWLNSKRYSNRSTALLWRLLFQAACFERLH